MTKNSLAEMMNNFKTVEAVNIDNLTKSEIIKKIEEYEKISSEEHLVLFLPCSAKAELNEKESKKVLSIFTEIDHKEDLEYFLSNIVQINKTYPDLTIEVKNNKTFNNLNIPTEVITMN
jgi:hypothetical protein